MAQALGAARGRKISVAVVTRKRQTMGLAKSRSGIPLVFAESAAARFDTPPVLNVDNVLVLADTHAPYHDAEWCSRVVMWAQGAGIRDVVIAGDLIDFEVFSSFVQAMVDEKALDLGDELKAAQTICETLLARFPGRVLMLIGNHERRLAGYVDVQVRLDILRRLLGVGAGRFELSPYSYAIVQNTAGEEWRVTHPKNSSVVPVSVAAKLADKYRQHVVAAHGHDWGEATSVSGRYAAASGCCADVTRLAYVALVDSTRPRPQNGAWALVRGKPVLLHPVYRPPEVT
jgi:hypothetical protein